MNIKRLSAFFIIASSICLSATAFSVNLTKNKRYSVDPSSSFGSDFHYCFGWRECVKYKSCLDIVYREKKKYGGSSVFHCNVELTGCAATSTNSKYIYRC